MKNPPNKILVNNIHIRRNYAITSFNSQILNKENLYIFSNFNSSLVVATLQATRSS